MRPSHIVAAAFCVLLGHVAIAGIKNPICLTLNQPGKWGAGLVLKIVGETDGTETAYLQTANMFFGSPTSNWIVLDTISQVTKSDATEGAVTYSRGSEFNATIGLPDEGGSMKTSIHIQLGDLNISAESASFTHFRDGQKCD